MIYLDHAAATPVSKKVLQAMTPFMTEEFFNPSSPYLPAARVRAAYEEAKNTIANFIGAKGTDLVITSGATEANALAFTAASGKILVLETEHASVLENAKHYDAQTIRVDKTGLIDLADLQAKLTDDVELVSVSLANNELGTIQPLAEIAQILRETRLDRLKRGLKTQLLLHSDASQGLALVDINVARLGVDLLTLNSAKVCGPKGVGALYVGHGVRLKPLIYGGGQERNLRSGTENVAGVVGFATALETIKGHTVAARKNYTRLVENLKKELSARKVEPVYLGNPKHMLANFLPLCFPGLDAERLIFKLEEQEVYASTGAACSASKGEPSHVLKAIGLTPEEIAGSLRLTLGVLNNEENVRQAGKILAEVVNAEYARMKNE
ncbi:cysteine desulfurase [Candidatus Saccharibacteria bacterium]|nr:cysteine desulfurase [Candidatus Saccharibacteria bacterium]MBR6122063.1 cysteine desulfurase [Candidatus Saccharibacteria bacterium]